MIISLFGNTTDALDVGYDTNGNRRHVVHYLPIYEAIKARTGMQHAALSSRPYDIAIDAMKCIGGKKYHNRKYGGGISFTLDSSQLERDIEQAIDGYSRWYNSENISSDAVEKQLDTSRHYLPIVVKSVNGGYKCSGEWSHMNPLNTRYDYDHGLIDRENTLKAAMLWARKCEYVRRMIDDRKIRILDQYTRIDANTVVYMYEFIENECVTNTKGSD